mmetsp:Transcript_27576/g.51169  ORF Transcript_27576/g.51169 Transcript_27576/m.51169 type:complete len:232 (-) Transcript_27576:163-858(-)
MGRPPIVDAIGPRVCPGLDRAKAVTAVCIRNRPPAATEIGVQWCKIPLLLVSISSPGIGLPKFEQRPRYAAPVFVQHATMHDGTLANGHFTSRCKIQDQIVVEWPEHILPKDGPGFFAERRVHRQECALRRAHHAGFIVRRQPLGVPISVAVKKGTVTHARPPSRQRSVWRASAHDWRAARPHRSRHVGTPLRCRWAWPRCGRLRGYALGFRRNCQWPPAAPGSASTVPAS